MRTGTVGGMAAMRFTKMQGIGNDYVYVDCFNASKHPAELSKVISDRQTIRRRSNRTGLANIGDGAGFGRSSDVFSRYMRMAGPRRAHGPGHRRARDAHRGRRRQARASPPASSPTRTTWSSSRTWSTGLSTTCSRARPRAATTTSCRSCSAASTRNGYMVEQTTFGGPLRLHRPHLLDLALHRGHLPDLRVRPPAWRPVRQLRQRADLTDLSTRGPGSTVRCSSSSRPRPLPRPARAGRGAAGVPSGPRGVGKTHLAAQRHQVLPQADRGPASRGR